MNTSEGKISTLKKRKAQKHATKDTHKKAQQCQFDQHQMMKNGMQRE
jgi:hypothetical protein